MALLRAAYFNLCRECGMHGCIVLAGGQESKEVGLILEALQMMRRLRTQGLITAEEAPELERQIRTADLPLDEDHVTPEHLARGIERLFRTAEAETEKAAEKAKSREETNQSLAEISELLKGMEPRSCKTLH